MYAIPSYVIALALFVCILLAFEVGFRIGKFHQKSSDREIKAQSTSIQAGILGLLALLLGFTFNMSLQRYDARSEAVIQEANAIGTTALRARLLPAPYDQRVYGLVQDYIDIRVAIAQVSLSRYDDRVELIRQSDEQLNKIWQLATEAGKHEPNPVTTGLFLASLNDMIDEKWERIEIQNRHIPEIILFLLFLVFVISVAITGYSGGLGSKRAYVPTVLLTLLITLVVFVIIDLDRPKRGLITVKQSYILQLQEQFGVPASVAAPAKGAEQ